MKIIQVIPTYNEARNIPVLVSSLFALDIPGLNLLFVDDNSPTFFNFDLCGPGWRAYDIAAFLQNTDLLNISQDLTEALFAGYYSERPLSDNEHAVVSPLLTVRRVWLTATFNRENNPVGYSFIASA